MFVEKKIGAQNRPCLVEATWYLDVAYLRHAVNRIRLNFFYKQVASKRQASLEKL